ncbi:hypothetical protein ACROYT_G021937 [Oculina patagonica]
MKLELDKLMREIQRDWYGKRGISLHRNRKHYMITCGSKNAGKNVTADSFDDDEQEDNEEEVKADDGTSNKGLLFVHQTSWQRCLLNRYGNELCLLDATYRTTKYSLPLYFLVVKTNIEYKVVASFVTQSETTDAIKEALSIIMKWNPDWDPKHFMVDYAEEEISAVEDLFPESKRGSHWVWAYRKDRILVIINTNNETERQNLAFKYEYLDMAEMSQQCQMKAKERMYDKEIAPVLLCCYTLTIYCIKSLSHFNCSGHSTWTTSFYGIIQPFISRHLYPPLSPTIVNTTPNLFTPSHFTFSPKATSPTLPASSRTFFGMKPCGIILFFYELFISESKSQLHGILHDVLTKWGMKHELVGLVKEMKGEINSLQGTDHPRRFNRLHDKLICTAIDFNETVALNKLRATLDKACLSKAEDTTNLSALWDRLALSKQAGRQVNLHAIIFGSLALEAEREADKLVRCHEQKASARHPTQYRGERFRLSQSY